MSAQIFARSIFETVFQRRAAETDEDDSDDDDDDDDVTSESEAEQLTEEQVVSV